MIILCSLFSVELCAVELIAHRGYSCGAAENTLKAVASAWLVGADGVELDLRTSKDGQLILFHDDSIHGRLISELTYSQILALSPDPVPSLESLLDLGVPPGYYILDLKEVTADGYLSLVSLIEASGIGEDRFVFQGPSISILTTINEALPGARVFYLSKLKRKFPFFLTPKAQKILARIDGYGFDGVSLKGRNFLDQRFVGAIKRAGYRVNVWTINEPLGASSYRDIGVDGIITDALEGVKLKLAGGDGLEDPCSGNSRGAG